MKNKNIETEKNRMSFGKRLSNKARVFTKEFDIENAFTEKALVAEAQSLRRIEEQNHAIQQTADQLREIREKVYEQSVHRLERFEQRAGGPLNVYDHNDKQYVELDKNGEPQLYNKPMSPEEEQALEDALRITEAYERDYDQEPWDSFEPPSFEEMEARETAYLVERTYEILEREERMNEEGFFDLER